MEQDYLDIFEGVKPDVMHTAHCDENSDKGSTHWGMPKMRRQDKLKVTHKAPITEDCYIPSKLLDGTDCKILLDMGASKLFMSKTYYLNCPSLHSLPNVVSKTKNILVGNGHYVGVLFVILVLINLQGRMFEVDTLVSEIHDNVEMVMGIKNVYEIGVISTRDSCLHFLNRSISFFPKTDLLLKPREQRFLKINVPFVMTYLDWLWLNYLILKPAVLMQ